MIEKSLTEMTTEEILNHIKLLREKRILAAEERVIERAKKEQTAKREASFGMKDLNKILENLAEDEEC